MILNPSVYNKIKQIVFIANEPLGHNVIWAKPEGDLFAFNIFYNGAWTNMNLFENVVIPEISVNLSAFNNDAGFLTEHQSLAEYINNGSYDSETKQINLKHGNTVLSSIDARDFIKDGMVNTVSLEGDSLVITFNTDAGKDPISIPIAQIFNPSNYYDKEDVNSLLASKADAASLSEVATSGSYEDLSDKPEIPSLDGYATELWVEEQGYLTEHQDISGKVDRQDLQYENLYLGVGDSVLSIATEPCHHDVLQKGQSVKFINVSGYIWAILPEEYTPTVKMNGFEVPIVFNTTIQIEGISYKAWRSTNTFAGDMSIYLF